MEDKNKAPRGFSYSYSAGEQAEIKRIREKYATPKGEEDPMARLRRLDAGVTAMAQAISLAFGVIGALLLGFGMSLVMSELGAGLGLSAGASLAVGIAVGLVGGVLAVLAYPVYHATVKARRKRIAPEILRLTDQLLK